MKSLLQRQVLQDVRDRLGALRPDSDARWGRMSAHQAVCHLADSFRLVLGERPTDMRGNLLSRTVIRFVALTLPVAWPRNVPTSPEADQERGGTAPTAFQADLDELAVLIRQVCRRGRSRYEHAPDFRRPHAGRVGTMGLSPHGPSFDPVRRVRSGKKSCPPSPSASLVHYVMAARLREGRMGQVWQATDARLGREVALKILSARRLCGRPGSSRRFTREAQIIASLNHSISRRSTASRGP